MRRRAHALLLLLLLALMPLPHGQAQSTTCPTTTPYGTPPYAPLTLDDIQNSTTGASTHDGSSVRTTGTIVGYISGGAGSMYLQDGTGSWSGLKVYGAEASMADLLANTGVGQTVTVEGLVCEYYGETEMMVDTMTNAGSANTSAHSVATGSASDEALEGVHVRLDNLTVTSAPVTYKGKDEFTVSDGTSDLKVRNDNPGFTYTSPSNGDTIRRMTGVLTYHWSEFKLLPTCVDASGTGACGSVDGTPPEPQPPTLYEIQYTTATSGISPHLGEEVNVSGVVTSVTDEAFTLQAENSSEWAGIRVDRLSSNGDPVAVGDHVAVNGTVAEQSGTTSLIHASTMSLGTGTVPVAVRLGTGAVAEERLESIHIQMVDLPITQRPSNSSEHWSVDDGSGNLTLIGLGDLTSLNETITSVDLIEGIVQERSGAFEVIVTRIVAVIPPPPVVTIEDIQSPDGSDNESNYDGMEVNVTGTVVAVDGSGYYLREDVEAWGSIYVFHPNAPNLTMGSVVQVIGTVIEFHGTTEVTMVRSMQVLTTASATPSPIQLDLHRVELEAWEGAWVTLGPVTLTGTPTQQGQWRIEDATGESNLHVMKSFRVGLDLPTTGIDMGKYDDVGLTLSDASYLGTTIAHINGTVWTSFEIRGIAPQDLGSLTLPDRDGDGVLDADDAFPDDATEYHDLDGDGTGDASDEDRDGDGWSDVREQACGSLPTDRLDRPADLDGDMTCDLEDDDVDGDGVNATLEAMCGTSDTNDQERPPDSDGDGVCDAMDSSESTNTTTSNPDSSSEDTTPITNTSDPSTPEGGFLNTRPPETNIDDQVSADGPSRTPLILAVAFVIVGAVATLVVLSRRTEDGFDTYHGGHASEGDLWNDQPDERI